MTTDLIRKWYEAVVKNCHLDSTTFQLMQGNMMLNYTSETLWNIFDAIPPESLNHIYNPAQINQFSNNYGAVIQNLNKSNLIVKEALEVWEKAGGFVAKKAYSKTINDLKQELENASGFSFQIDTDLETPDLSQTWACGNIENNINLFKNNQVETIQPAPTLENADTIIKVEFQKLITFVATPLSQKGTLNPDLTDYNPWYNSAALQLAYHQKETWINPQFWDTYFGNNGSMPRCCVSLVIVDGITTEMPVTYNNIAESFLLFFKKTNDTTEKMKKTIINNGKSIKRESPLGNPCIIGANVLTIPKCLGFSTIPVKNESEISQELEKLLDSMDVIRKIAIAINNYTEQTLIDPKYYLENGVIERTDLTIYDKQVGFITSRKTEYSTFGTWGVVTYQIKNTTEKLAIMWSVPLNYTIYENWFKLAIINSNLQTDKKLLYDMYYNKDMTQGKVQKASTGSYTWQQKGYELQGIMGTGGSCTLNISLKLI